MYGTMMGSTSVTIDDINDTARIIIEGYIPIDTGDPMAYMAAMSTLIAIEHFAMTHSVLIRECNQVASMPKTQRALTAGILINRIAVEQMDEHGGETVAHSAAIGGGDGMHANPNAHATIRGSAPNMPQLPIGDGTTTTDATNGTHTTEEMNDTHTMQHQPPPPTQRHHTDGTMTAASEPQQKVHFAAPQFGGEHGPRAGGGVARAYYDSTTEGHELQQQHASTRDQPQTHTHHQLFGAVAPTTAVPEHAAQHQASVSTVAHSAQQNTGRPTQQQTLPQNFFGPQMQAQVRAQQQAEQAAQLQFQ